MDTVPYKTPSRFSPILHLLIGRSDRSVGSEWVYLLRYIPWTPYTFCNVCLPATWQKQVHFHQPVPLTTILLIVEHTHNYLV